MDFKLKIRLTLQPERGRPPITAPTQNLLPIHRRACVKIRMALAVAGFGMLMGGQASAAKEELACSFSGSQCWVQDITAPEEIEARKADFKAEFQHIGIQGEIDHCDSLVEELLDRQTAYGGACTLRFEGEKREWVVCDDNYVGSWAAEFGVFLRPKTRRSQIIQYTRDHCLGG